MNILADENIARQIVERLRAGDYYEARSNMASSTDIKHIVTDPEVYGGRPIIEGHRIAVIDVAVRRQQGMTPEEIAEDYSLSLVEVHAALAYYYDHKAELDARLGADEQMLAEYAAKDTSPIMERLREEAKRIREERAAGSTSGRQDR